MKVLQLIDSLEAGGAERIAVTFANALAQQTDGSYLATTRREGALKATLQDKVGYRYLNKRHTLDLRALFLLRSWIKEEHITIVHAHTTSYFFATLLKISCPKIALIWHEHSGKRIFTKRQTNKMLYLCSFFFSEIITVNKELALWAVSNLKTKKVNYLSNFVSDDAFIKQKEVEQKKVVCLANLRVPKNHLNLLQAWKIVIAEYPGWKLQLIGADHNDDYSKELKDFCKKNNLKHSVAFTGATDQPEVYLNTAAIGVLASDSEGLPMALLEYGASRLAVVTTDVGECKHVVGTSGKIVPASNSKALALALCGYIASEEIRKRDARAFYNTIKETYSMTAVLPDLLAIYKQYDS